MSDNSRPNNRVLLLSEMLRGQHKFFVNSSIFLPIKILQSKFSFYCNKLKEIIQFNSGVPCTIKCWRIEQRKHQNNSNSWSKVFVHGGHPKCIINTALSLAITSRPPKAGHGFAALQKSTTVTTAIFGGLLYDISPNRMSHVIHRTCLRLLIRHNRQTIPMYCWRRHTRVLSLQLLLFFYHKVHRSTFIVYCRFGFLFLAMTSTDFEFRPICSGIFLFSIF